jgi:hypothetical protein
LIHRWLLPLPCFGERVFFFTPDKMWTAHKTKSQKKSKSLRVKKCFLCMIKVSEKRRNFFRKKRKYFAAVDLTVCCRFANGRLPIQILSHQNQLLYVEHFVTILNLLLYILFQF